MTGRLAGRRIFVLARLSGDGQIGNWSEQEQIDAQVRFIQAEGGTPVPLYENVEDEHGRKRGVSGKSLRRRKVTLGALAQVEAGEAEGIGWADHKRLSRNEYQEDQGEILRRMQAVRAVIVIGTDVIRPWDKDDRKRYKVMCVVTEDGPDLRDTFFRGIFGRAKVEPVVRGTYPVGFLGVPHVRKRGTVEIIQRLPGKDPACAGLLADLRDWYAGCATYGEVAARVNAKWSHLLGQAGNRHRKLFTAEGHPMWGAAQARDALKNRKYAGYWGIGDRSTKSEVWDADTRRERLAEYTHYFPELAYWTLAEAAAWRERLAQNRRGPGFRGRRARAKGPDGTPTAPPLVGVLACPECHTPLSGRGQGLYACPRYQSGTCAAPAFIKEHTALAALDGILPEVLGRTRALAAAIRRHQTKAGATEAGLLEELRGHQEGKQSLLDDWYPGGRKRPGTPPEMLDRIAYHQQEIDRLREGVARAEEARAEDDDYLARVERVLAGDPAEQVAAFRFCPVPVQVALWGELVVGVEIQGEGRGRYRTHTVVPGWRLKGERLHSEDTPTCASAKQPIPPGLLAVLLAA